MATRPDAIGLDAIARAEAAKTKLLKAFTAKTADDGLRRIKFLITTNDVDRDNDVIDVNGWMFSNYLKNPVVLWAHDASLPPIARCVSLTRAGNGIVAIAEFPPEGMNPFADMIYRMLHAGFLSAVSVGFRCTRYAINAERDGVDFLEQELLEFSVCPVPANQNALVAASMSGIDLAPINRWAKDWLRAAEGGNDELDLELDDDEIDVDERDLEAALRATFSEEGLTRLVRSAVARHTNHLNPAVACGLVEDAIEVDPDDLARAIERSVVDTLGDLAREAAHRTFNQMRGRLD